MGNPFEKKRSIPGSRKQEVSAGFRLPYTVDCVGTHPLRPAGGL